MSSTAPTLAGYIGFCRTIAGIPYAAMPDSSPGFAETLAFAQQWVPNDQLPCISPMLYTAAVYNWGVSLLIQLQPDQPGQCYFSNLRTTFKSSNFVPGVVSSTSDEATSTTLTVGTQLSNMSLLDLQMAQDPFGRRALAIVGSLGPASWGLS